MQEKTTKRKKKNTEKYEQILSTNTLVWEIISEILNQKS